MVSRTCSSCGAALRPQSRFCPKCATPITGGGQPGQGSGYTVRPPASPPPVSNPRVGAGTPARGTFVKEERKRPGTILYGDRETPPVLGWLVIMKGKRRGTDFKIDKDSITIGREGSCDVALDDETASREHARIRKDGQTFVLFDLGSANGTFLNREQIQKQQLEDGDVLRVGETLLIFKEAKPGPKWKSPEDGPEQASPADTEESTP